MMIQRTKDTQLLNRLVNDPSVFPMVSFDGDTEADLTDFVNNPNNIALASEDKGCFLLIWMEPGVYELHTCFTDKGRGKYVIRAFKEMFEYMFIQTDCYEILTKVPLYNLGADWIARHMGFTFEFECQTRFRKNGELVDMKFYAMRIQDWIKQAPGLEEEGRRFHDKLHSEKDRLGIHSVDHPDDTVHDKHVGLIMKMIYAGQVVKGVILYNRWAKFCWYAPVDIVSLNPLVIDIKDGYIKIADNDFTLEN